MSARLDSAAKAFGKAAADYGLAHKTWSCTFPGESRARYDFNTPHGPQPGFDAIVQPALEVLNAAERELCAAARHAYDGAPSVHDEPAWAEKAS